MAVLEDLVKPNASISTEYCAVRIPSGIAQLVIIIVYAVMNTLTHFSHAIDAIKICHSHSTLCRKIHSCELPSCHSRLEASLRWPHPA